MKKTIKVLVLLVFLIFLSQFTYLKVFASGEFVIEDNVLIKCNDTSARITVPEGVVEIGEAAFQNNTSVISITLPKSVKKIGVSAFSGCTNLSEINLENVESISEKSFEGVSIDTVVFSDSVKEIPLGAFAYAQVRVVELGENVEIISDSAFYNCTNLSTIVLNDKLYAIGDKSFQSCTSLESIELGKNINSLGVKCFYGSGLKKILIPSSCKLIDGSCFNGCASLEEVTFENGVETIEGSAFYETKIRKINLPQSVSNLKEFALEGISTLEEINVDENNEYYASEDGILYNKDFTTLIRLPSNYQKKDVIINAATTFVSERGCANLVNVKTVVFQEGLETINHLAFVNSTSVEKIVLPNSLKYIYGGAFSYATSLYDITLPEGLLTLSTDDFKIAGGVFQGCSSLISITIPSSVTSMGSCTFNDCTLLETVVINGNFIKYGTNQFGGNQALKSIEINGNNPFAFVDENGVYYEVVNGEKYLSLFPACLEVVEYVVPSEITHIQSLAFSCVQNLQKLTIPDTVTYVGEKICYASKIKTINFYANVTEIPNATFANSEVETVNIGNKIKVVGVYAFSGTKKLKEVVLPNSITTLSRYCFTESSIEKLVMPDSITNIENPCVMARKLKELVLSKGLSVIPQASFSYCDSLEEIIVPENVIRIEEYGFGCCKNLKKVSLPSTLVEFTSVSFAECPSLELVEINENNPSVKVDSGIIYNSDFTKILFVNHNLPSILYLKDTLTEVPAYAFKDKVGVIELHIPASLTNIGYNSFKSFSVQKVVFEEGVKKIPYDMFNNCTELKEIVFPKTLEKIESGVFAGCISLEKVEIPDNVDISEGYSLFSNCTNLKEVKLPNNCLIIPQYLFAGCSSLETVTIPENTTTIEMYAFKDCVSMKLLVVPEKVVSLEIGIFEGSSIAKVIMLPFSAPSLKTSQFGNNYFETFQTIYIYSKTTGYTSSSFKKYQKQMSYLKDEILNEDCNLELLDNGDNTISLSFVKIPYLNYSLFQIINNEEIFICNLTQNTYLFKDAYGGKEYQFLLKATIVGDAQYTSTSLKKIYISKSISEMQLDYLIALMKNGLIDDLDCYEDILTKYDCLDEHCQQLFNEQFNIENIKLQYQALKALQNVEAIVNCKENLKIGEKTLVSVLFTNGIDYDYEIISTNENIVSVENQHIVGISDGTAVIQIVSAFGVSTITVSVQSSKQIAIGEIILIIVCSILLITSTTTLICLKKREKQK